MLGTNHELLPASVIDFVKVIADQLGIPRSALQDMPPRPSPSLPFGSADGDKLHKWASDEIPLWFGNVLREHRERVIDLRDEARNIVELFKLGGLPPPPEQVKIAQSREPVTDLRNRWPIAWIVLDDLTENSFSEGGVRDLIVGLIGGHAAESAVPEDLRRLRWIFLGYKPDFVDLAQACHEVLDPMSVGVEAATDCVSGLYEAYGDELSDRDRTVVAHQLSAYENATADLQDSTRRLETFQNYLNQLALILLNRREHQ
jgi:hypothetical protein